MDKTTIDELIKCVHILDSISIKQDDLKKVIPTDEIRDLAPYKQNELAQNFYRCLGQIKKEIETIKNTVKSLKLTISFEELNRMLVSDCFRVPDFSDKVSKIFQDSFVDNFGRIQLSISDYDDFFSELNKIKEQLQQEVNNTEDMVHEIESDEAYYNYKNTLSKKVFTCGVRWGNGATSFKDILLDHSIALLGVEANNANSFSRIKKGDLIVIKDGYNITHVAEALSIPKKKTWGSISNVDFDKYDFDTNTEIYIVAVLMWLDIRNKNIRIQSIDTGFQSQNTDINVKIAQEYNKLLQDKSIELLRKQALILRDRAFEDAEEKLKSFDERYNSFDTLYTSLEKKYQEKLQPLEEKLKIQEWSGFYKEKIGNLNKTNFENKFHISVCINIGIVILGIVIQFIPNIWNITLPDLLRIILGVSFFSISLFMLWITRYYNRRLHEVIHFIEEYDHRRIVLDMYQFFKDDLGTDTVILHNLIISSPSKILEKKNKNDATPIDDLTKIGSLLKDLSSISNKKEN